MTERVLEFSIAGESAMGLLSLPALAGDTGVIVVVGGPQYRAGSHRQFALLARQLAAGGFATLRFDQRGSGDSGGEQRSFENLDEDIRAAIDALLAAQPAVRRVVLWGLCDAASAALLYCARQDDGRVAGLCLLNPWVRSPASLARTQLRHYYLRRLLQGEFWLKLLRGGVGAKALKGLAENAQMARSVAGNSSAAFQDLMAKAWRDFKGPMLLILSGDDYTAKEFLDHAGVNAKWRGSLKNANVTRIDLPGVDHTFSNAQARLQVETQCLDWLGDAFGAVQQ